MSNSRRTLQAGLPCQGFRAFLLGSGATTFDNRRLIAEGMDPPPAFAEYLGTCIRTGEGEPIANQMRYDFR